MSQFEFGFIGCGNMGGALAQAASKVIPAERLAVCDSDASKTEFLTKEKKATAATLAEVAQNSRYIFLAVKPQGMRALLETLDPILGKRSDPYVLVSIAAGVTLAEIEEMVQTKCPVIRMMPNTPVLVGKGMTLYTANSMVSDEQIEGYLNGLSASGRFDRIAEGLIDAAGSLSGCGPAFVYLFAEGLADGGVAGGVPRDKALLYAAQTLAGAAEMLLQTGKHPGELKDAVCSPGGTTIEGVRALEEGALRATCMNAVLSALEKTKRLKK